MERVRRPIHPGEILRDVYMQPLGLSQNELARVLHVDPTRINRIVLGSLGVSADTALRLARYFGTTPQLWLNLQARYDLEMVKLQKGAEIDLVQARSPQKTFPFPQA